MLNGFVYKLRGIHGIRWVASMRNILAKVYKMLHIIVMDLDIRAKEKFGCASHTTRCSWACNSSQMARRANIEFREWYQQMMPVH